MNKYLSFLLISLSLSCQTPQEVKHTDASPLNIVHYEPTNEAIINPERGFLTQQDQKSNADELTIERVKNYRQQNGHVPDFLNYSMNTNHRHDS